MVRIFIGLAVVTVALIALCTFLASLYQTKKEQRLEEAQEKERRENLGDALYDTCNEMDAAAGEIEKFCAAREFGEWESIRKGLSDIAGVLGKTSRFVEAHPGPAGNMNDVITHLLPLIRKMMVEYDLCITHGAENTAARENLKIIDKCLREAGGALDKKLSALFEGRAYDLQAELFVLESQREGEWKLD
ncbi:MAG: hypothetical protein FWE19_03790 [Oscillospiraceae bacterium]|nr:hypothetical protein [Oscillospiraceae bacterium]